MLFYIFFHKFHIVTRIPVSIEKLGHGILFIKASIAFERLRCIKNGPLRGNPVKGGAAYVSLAFRILVQILHIYGRIGRPRIYHLDYIAANFVTCIKNFVRYLSGVIDGYIFLRSQKSPFCQP